MPDLFDNLINKFNVAVHGRSSEHYGGSNQVNAGRYYNYHNSGTNNAYWMPYKKAESKADVPKLDNGMKQDMKPEDMIRSDDMMKDLNGQSSDAMKPRMGSVSSERSRFNSVSSESSDLSEP